MLNSTCWAFCVLGRRRHVQPLLYLLRQLLVELQATHQLADEFALTRVNLQICSGERADAFHQLEAFFSL